MIYTYVTDPKSITYNELQFLSVAAPYRSQDALEERIFDDVSQEIRVLFMDPSVSTTSIRCEKKVDCVAMTVSEVLN